MQQQYLWKCVTLIMIYNQRCTYHCQTGDSAKVSRLVFDKLSAREADALELINLKQRFCRNWNENLHPLDELTSLLCYSRKNLHAVMPVCKQRTKEALENYSKFKKYLFEYLWAA